MTSVLVTSLLLAGFLASEVVIVATSDHIAQALVRPAIGDAVYSGPPLAHLDEPDYSAISETDLLRLATGQPPAGKQP